MCVYVLMHFECEYEYLYVCTLPYVCMFISCECGCVGGDDSTRSRATCVPVGLVTFFSRVSTHCLMFIEEFHGKLEEL